jgi:hypothetical protein
VLHLVRHGEVYNPQGVLYGRLPGFHLSEDGKLMAKAAAGFLSGRDVVALRSSPLDRTLETAAPLAAQFGLEVVTDQRLIEPTNRFEGTTVGVGSGALRNPAKPLLAIVAGSKDHRHGHGGARVHRRPDAVGHGRGGPGHPGPRSGLREPPAADLDRPAGGRGQAPVA